MRKMSCEREATGNSILVKEMSSMSFIVSQPPLPLPLHQIIKIKIRKAWPHEILLFCLHQGPLLGLAELPVVPLPASSSVATHCQIQIEFPRWTFTTSWSFHTDLFPPPGTLGSPCYNSLIPPMGFPSLGACSPSLAFLLSSHPILGAQLCGEMQRREISIFGDTVTAGRLREKGLWVKACCLQVVVWSGVQHLPELAQQPRGFTKSRFRISNNE